MNENEKLKEFIKATALMELLMDSMDTMLSNKWVKHQLKQSVKRTNEDLKKHLDLFYDHIEPDIASQIIDFTILIKKNMEVRVEG
jgi:hypothetical protein